MILLLNVVSHTYMETRAIMRAVNSRCSCAQYLVCNKNHIYQCGILNLFTIIGYSRIVRGVVAWISCAHGVAVP